MKRVTVGVIGCGKISDQYLGNAKKFPILDVVAVADLNRAAAEKQAAAYGVPRVLSVDELIADPSIQVTLNLTIPAAHMDVAIRSLEAGKHTFAEKPLAVNRDEGRRVLEAAKRTGLRVGCAPDTFLGAGVQTARKLIDDGAIGRPVAFTAFMLGRGHEHWHPSPEFYYAPGGGPMFDMGPYYLTALLQLLGPMRRVTGFASKAITDRTITSNSPLKGKKIDVQTPDHVAGTIEFSSGCVGTIVTSFATRAAQYNGKQPIQIFGDKGSILVPDPNGFDGPVRLCTYGEKDEFVDVEPLAVTDYGRAVGLADLADAIGTSRPHRASLEQAYAVLDAMQGFLDSSDTGRAIDIAPGYERPPALDGSKGFGVF